MAIDTAAKRASAANFGRFGNGYLIPDGTIGQADKQSITGLYAGILADEIVVVNNPSITITGIVTAHAKTGQNRAHKITPDNVAHDKTPVLRCH